MYEIFIDALCKKRQGKCFFEEHVALHAFDIHLWIFAQLWFN